MSTVEPEEQRMKQHIGLSYVEVHYLLGLAPTDSSVRSRERLGLFGFDDPQLLSDIGSSTLLARELIGVTADTGLVVPLNEAMFVSYVLLNATRWTTFGSTDGGEKGDTGFLIESDMGSVLVQPRAINTWWFVLIDDVAVSNDVIVETVKGLAAQAEEMAIVLRTETLAADSSFTIHITGDDWSYAAGVTGSPEPESRVEGTDAATTEASLRAFLAAA